MNEKNKDKHTPILDGRAHREREQLASAAASASLTAMQQTDVADPIVLDHREAKSTLAPYLKSMGAHVEFSHLPTGDIRLSKRVLIERKTARDLVNSITDGRLLHQCRRLNAAALRPLLLIEIGEVPVKLSTQTQCMEPLLTSALISGCPS